MTADFEAYRRRFQAHFFAGLSAHVERLAWNGERIRAHQTASLRSLLAHAIARSPFHARRLRGLDVDRFEVDDLARLPILTKAEMMAAFDTVVTDRRLTLDLVDRTLAETGETPIPLFGEYVCQASGGSSGCRGAFVLDLPAMLDFASSLMRPTAAAMAQRGGLPKSGLTIAFVAAPSAIHATGIPPKVMEGSPIRFVPAPATLPLREIVARLNAARPDALFGYPSLLACLAIERCAGRLTIAPSSIRSTSETLAPEQRAAITEAFGIPVVDTFGSSEGLVGLGDPGDPVLTFASDVCIVELVDADNRPVPRGTPSAKILVTNLSNRAQPLIRYVIEDIFVRQPDANDHGHLRATVRGRSTDVFHYEDAAVHPLVIGTVLVRHAEIVDYQVRQIPRGVDVALIASGPLDCALLRGGLREALSRAGIVDPVVTARIVPALERQPGTGKMRRYLPA